MRVLEIIICPLQPRPYHFDPALEMLQGACACMSSAIYSAMCAGYLP